jgi:hypothetical protein
VYHIVLAYNSLWIFSVSSKWWTWDESCSNNALHSTHSQNEKSIFKRLRHINLTLMWWEKLKEWRIALFIMFARLKGVLDLELLLGITRVLLWLREVFSNRQWPSRGQPSIYAVLFCKKIGVFDVVLSSILKWEMIPILIFHNSFTISWRGW